jgi:hypothetical protein
MVLVLKLQFTGCKVHLIFSAIEKLNLHNISIRHGEIDVCSSHTSRFPEMQLKLAIVKPG